MSSCKPKLSLEEKELDILRDAVDIAEKRKGKQTVSDPDVKKIIGILEDFLKKKKLICYGGTAINNIIPKIPIIILAVVSSFLLIFDILLLLLNKIIYE